MAPPLGILKPIGKVEVEQANGVHGVQMEVPVASTLCLLAYGEGGTIKLLVHILNPSPRVASAISGRIKTSSLFFSALRA